MRRHISLFAVAALVFITSACSFDDEKTMADSKAEKQREDVITEPGAESSGNSGAGLDRVYGSPSNSGNTGLIGGGSMGGIGGTAAGGGMHR